MLLINLFLGICICSGFSSESLIRNGLMTNYHKDTIPLLNGSRVELRMGIMLRAINSIDHIDGTFKLNIWLRYKWFDYRLIWNHPGIDSMVFRTDPSIGSSIWVPDIYLYNTAENPLVDMAHTNAVVNKYGEVVLSRPGIITSTCNFNLSQFPYDTQYCDLKMGSWSYSTKKIYLNQFNPSIDISSFQENEEWVLINYSTWINEEKYACCENTFQDITFKLILKRKSSYYDQNLVIPAVSTASLMIFTMFIPWDSGERISYATTIMLSIVVFLLILSDHLPKTNNRPLLSTLFITLVLYSLIGLFFTIIVSFIRNKYKENNTPTMMRLETTYSIVLFLAICIIVCIFLNKTI